MSHLQLIILKNNIGAIVLDIGGKMIPKLTNFTTSLNELDKETKDNIATGAEWTLGIAGTAGIISLLTIGITRLIAFLGTAAGAFSAAITAPIIFTTAMDRLSDTVGNKWVKAVLEGLSPMQTMWEQFMLLKDAAKLVEDGTLSWIGVLFTGKEKLRALIETTEEATESQIGFADAVIPTTSAFQDLETRVNAYKDAQGKANEVTQQGTTDTLGLEAATFNLWETLNLLSGGLEQQEGNFVAFRDSLKNIASNAWDLNNALRAIGEGLGNIPNETVKRVTFIINRKFAGVTGLGVPTFGLGFADGGTTPFSGQFLVGEKGPEIVDLPGGSRITPNKNLGQAVSGSQENQEIIVPVKVFLNDEVIFESVERVSNQEDFRRID